MARDFHPNFIGVYWDESDNTCTFIFNDEDTFNKYIEEHWGSAEEHKNAMNAEMKTQVRWRCVNGKKY